MAAVAERILTVIESRLDEITKANGYPIDAIVHRATRATTISPVDNAIYVSLDELTPNPNNSYPSNPPVQGWDMVVRCSMIATPAETSSTAADSFRLEAYTAMSQAITDATAWYRFTETVGDPPVSTNLAINAMIESPERMVNAEQGQVGMHLMVRVMFRTTEGDPEAVRS